MKKKMLLFGGSGLLGSRIKFLLNDYDIYVPLRSEVDLTKRKIVEKKVSNFICDVIVYAAGITNQDFAETNQDLAILLNKESVKWIAKIAASKKIPLVYFSTDAVFPGTQRSKPYSETDATSPVNFYGFTKASGEEVVLSSSKDNLIIRLISLYSGYHHTKIDFARLLVNKLTEGKSCYGITDQYFNPCFADTTVKCLQILIDKKVSNIVHLGASDFITNYEFAEEIARIFSLEESLIKRTTLKDFFSGRFAKRARYPWLDTTLAQKIVGKDILHTNKVNIKLFYKQVLDYNSSKIA